MTGKDVHVKSYTRDDVIRDIANKGKDAWNKIPKPIKTVLAQALIQSVLYNPSSAANAKVVSGGQRLQNTSAEAKQYPIIKDNKYNIHKYKNNSNNIVKPEEKYSYIKKYKEPQLQKPNSQLRKKIENSRRNEEIYKLLNLSTNKLIKINDTGLKALPKLAINNADILFAYYDQNENQKNLIMVLLDTYDFNKGENILVELGRSPQEAGILDGYFSLFFVLVPSSLLKE